eukprot:TRINITY_DN2276_c0_g1_i3.p1 TRINITY_DN2276_c0_g1~~TRINITY_DN2276_c0_g1_i3.p1  ORF type:complete len:133 (-),score=4.56 TRINITY_DN2276_c0_g1_i3:212-610(-)
MFFTKACTSLMPAPLSLSFPPSLSFSVSASIRFCCAEKQKVADSVAVRVTLVSVCLFCLFANARGIRHYYAGIIFAIASFTLGIVALCPFLCLLTCICHPSIHSFIRKRNDSPHEKKGKLENSPRFQILEKL